MNRSLFTLPLSEITIEDIEAFCNQRLPEGERIEYKSKLNNDKVVQTIAAMANTDGGVVLIGVQEEKDAGGQRSYPGAISGIDARNDPGLSITNRCYTNLQPAWVPEIKEIPLREDATKAVILVRIDENRIPASPILYRDKGVYIRFGEENRIADLERMRLLFKEGESAEHRIETDFAGWLTGKLPNLPEFCWFSIGVVLPMRRFIGRLSWDSSQIEQLGQAVENHKIGRGRVWTQKWYPLPVEPKDSVELLVKKAAAREAESPPVRIEKRRGEQWVQFYPDPVHPQTGPLYLRAPDSKKGEWFQFWFDARGYMLASVGFPWGLREVADSDVCAVFYAMLDLFTQPQVKKCYPDCLWEGGDFKIFAKVSQSPKGIKTTWTDIEPPRDFPTQGSEWDSGVGYGMESVPSLEPEKMAKEFTKGFLAWVGFLHFETVLAEFNIEDVFQR